MHWKKENKRGEKMPLKKSFEENYQALLGKDYDKFIECSMHYLPRAFRVNTIKAKINVVDRLKNWELEPVPWCKEAFWIRGERRDIGNLLEHQLGYLYIQDPASMIPPVVLNPKPGDRVLDMCAAPGSKTSQAAAMMKNKGIIVANDSDGMRLAPLGVNLQKLGVLNTVMTRKDGRQFSKFEFDKIMIDAPCSAIGTLRRSMKALVMYNPKAVESLSRLQIKLLQAGFNALKKGGELTYSTCTLEPLENEVVVSKLIENNEDASVVDFKLDIKREKNVMEHPKTGEKLDKSVGKTLRIHPYTNNTEGFYVAKIRKA